MSLETKFELYRENELKGLWISYKLIKSLLSSLSENIFKISILGHSERGTPIHKIEMGTGSIKIVLWSQMHGDESTATKSMFDLFNYIQKEYLNSVQLRNLLKKCTLIFVPMLNPDGALAYTRENAKDIDLNRDAIKLETKEGKLLHQLVKSIQPDFAFNLHDQTSFYNVLGSEKVATLSFLAPTADKALTITDSRREAMSVIVSMNQALQKHIPNQIGRYSDAFCKSCFGDAIQMMNFPTILIEAGYYPGDEEREETRKLHFIALLTALFDIASDKLPDYKAYFDIPLNEKLFYDIRFDNVIFNGINTSVAVRYKYILNNGALLKVIVSEETISGDLLLGKLFHTIIDKKGKRFLDIS